MVLIASFSVNRQLIVMAPEHLTLFKATIPRLRSKLWQITINMIRCWDLIFLSQKSILGDSERYVLQWMDEIFRSHTHSDITFDVFFSSFSPDLFSSVYRNGLGAITPSPTPAQTACQDPKPILLNTVGVTIQCRGSPLCCSLCRVFDTCRPLFFYQGFCAYTLWMVTKQCWYPNVACWKFWCVNCHLSCFSSSVPRSEYILHPNFVEWVSMGTWSLSPWSFVSHRHRSLR